MLSTLKKIDLIITKRQRKGLMLLSILLTLGMALEILGLASLMPALSIITDPGLVFENNIFNDLYLFVNATSYNKFVVLVLSLVTLMYFLKTIFLVFLSYKQNSFLTNLTANISIKLFNRYILAPFSFHIDSSSSKLLKNIQVELNFFSTYCTALLTLIVEFFLSISVIFFMIYIEPFGAIFIGVIFGCLSFLFFQFTKTNIMRLGEQREVLDKNISEISFNSFGAIKEIKVFRKENFFLDKFNKMNYSKAIVNSKYLTLNQIPRFFLEFVAVFGLVTLIIFMIYFKNDVSTLFASIAVFVAGTFRLIPSLNRIVASLQTLKFYQSSIDVIYTEIKNKTVNVTNEKSLNLLFENEIEFKNVKFSFDERLIFDNLNLTIHKGQSIGLIGESGIGKSTLINLLIGLLKPEEGRVIVDGENIKNNSSSWLEKIGYIPQNIYLTDGSIKDNIAFGLHEDEVDIIRLDKAMKGAEIYDFVYSLSDNYNAMIGENGVKLSGGQRQRIGIARALYKNPEILILDEATASLDKKTELNVMNSIINLKGSITLLIIAHNLNTLSSCDFIYSIKDGKLIKKDVEK